MPDPRLQPRVQKGVPTAGRFTFGQHSESTVTLDPGAYEQACDRDLYDQSSPTLYGEPSNVLPDNQQDGLDRDLEEIRRNRSIQPAVKLLLEDMARQIEEFGVVRMAGPGPVADVRFGKGSDYGATSYLAISGTCATPPTRTASHLRPPSRHRHPQPGSRPPCSKSGASSNGCSPADAPLEGRAPRAPLQRMSPKGTTSRVSPAAA